MKQIAAALVIQLAHAGCCFDVGYGTNMEECCQSNFVDTTQLACQTAFRVGAADSGSSCGLPTFSMGATKYDPRPCSEVQASLVQAQSFATPAAIPSITGTSGGQSATTMMMVDPEIAMRSHEMVPPAAPKQTPLVFTLAAGTSVSQMLAKLGADRIATISQQGDVPSPSTPPAPVPSSSAGTPCPLGYVWCATSGACTRVGDPCGPYNSVSTNPTPCSIALGLTWCPAFQSCAKAAECPPSLGPSLMPLTSKAACDQQGTNFIWCPATQSCNLAISGCNSIFSSLSLLTGPSSCTGLGLNVNWCAGFGCIMGPCPTAVGGAYSPPTPAFTAPPWAPPTDSCSLGRVWCAVKSRCILIGNDCDAPDVCNGRQTWCVPLNRCALPNQCPNQVMPVPSPMCGPGYKWCAMRSSCILSASPCP